MGREFLRLPCYEQLRLSDIHFERPYESFDFSNIKVRTIDIAMPETPHGSVEIQITARCNLEHEEAIHVDTLGTKPLRQPNCRYVQQPVFEPKVRDELSYDLGEFAKHMAETFHQHDFKYQGIVDGKHRFMCTCGEVREEELANGSRSQQDSTGSDASNQ